jgi:glutathione S-transferase
MTDITPRRLVLWGVGTSRTVRAHWALHELDLDYECRAILPRTGETQTAEYTELNPRQKIPLLQDGDFKIAESPAIAAYLSDTYGTRENALIPTNPREHATWLEWCFYAATELDATSLYVMRRHGDLKHIYGEAPVALESAASYFEKQLRHAEQALQDGRATGYRSPQRATPIWRGSRLVRLIAPPWRLISRGRHSRLSLPPLCLSRYGERPGDRSPLADVAGFWRRGRDAHGPASP